MRTNCPRSCRHFLELTLAFKTGLALWRKFCFTSVAVQQMVKIFRLRAIGRLVVVSLMAGLCLGTVLLRVSPQLHHWLHHDSANASHECLVTLITKGHLLAGAAEAKAVIPVAPVFSPPLLDPVWNFSAADYRSSQSRAPPFISSSLLMVG
jgi:hypothetical protein